MSEKPDRRVDGMFMYKLIEKKNNGIVCTTQSDTDNLHEWYFDAILK